MTLSQTASHKTIIQLNDADPKSKSFPFDTKTCRYPHTIFHSENNSSKELLEIVSTSARQLERVSLVCYLKYSVFKMSLLIVTRTE